MIGVKMGEDEERIVPFSPEYAKEIFLKEFHDLVDHEIAKESNNISE